MIRPKAYFDNGFSLAELLVVIVIIGVLGSVGIQILSRLFERIRAQEAQINLLHAYKECTIEIQAGNSDPTYTIPPNTDYFQYPDSGDDGKCLSPSSGNILTAARTSYGQAVSNYNLNINVKTGDKSTDREVPTYISWE